MTIHPATIKAAAAKGVELAHNGEANHYAAALKDGRIFVQPADDQDAPGFLKAVVHALAWEAHGFEGIKENEAVRIEQASADDDFVARLMIDGKPAGELARDPLLADLLETLDDEDETQTQIDGIRDDAEDEEEPETSGSVVPDTFKKRYAEAGHPGHCGDWLAVTLNALVQVTDGKKVATDIDRLETIANANGVAPARVDRLGTATNGWQGRYRMTVRNMLAKVVADKGELFVPEGCGVKEDTTYAAPADWCDKYRTRVKAKAAPKAAVAKDEGAGKPSAKAAAKTAAKPAVTNEKVAIEAKKPYTNGRRAKK